MTRTKRTIAEMGGASRARRGRLPRGVRRLWACLGTIVLGGVLAVGPTAHVWARWFPGHGRGTVAPAEGVEGAVDAAFAAARRQALAQALDALGAPVPADVRKTLVDRSFERWTQSYRVVSQVRRGTVVEVRLEVDVDLGRLARAVGVATPASRTVRRAVFGDGCEAVSDAVRQRLGGDRGATPVAAVIACRIIGIAPVAGVVVATATAVSPTAAATGSRVTVTGSGADEQAAVEAAVARLAGRIRVGPGAGPVRLRFGPDVAARTIRRVARAIRRTIPSAVTAYVCGVEPGGRVDLCVEGSGDLPALADVAEGASGAGERLEAAIDVVSAVVYVGGRP